MTNNANYSDVSPNGEPSFEQKFRIKSNENKMKGGVEFVTNDWAGLFTMEKIAVACDFPHLLFGTISFVPGCLPVIENNRQTRCMERK